MGLQFLNHGRLCGCFAILNNNLQENLSGRAFFQNLFQVIDGNRKQYGFRIRAVKYSRYLSFTP